MYWTQAVRLHGPLPVPLHQGFPALLDCQSPPRSWRRGPGAGGRSKRYLALPEPVTSSLLCLAQPRSLPPCLLVHRTFPSPDLLPWVGFNGLLQLRADSVLVWPCAVGPEELVSASSLCARGPCTFPHAQHCTVGSSVGEACMVGLLCRGRATGCGKSVDSSSDRPDFISPRRCKPQFSYL